MAEETVTEVKEDTTANLTKEGKDLIEKIKGMTVLDLSNLVKALEDEFGVIAAAPVAVAGAAAPGGGGDADAGGPSTVSVIITGAGDKKIQVLKAVRELTGLGLKEAKDLVDNVPKAVKEDIEKEEADKIKAALEEQGAQVEIK